MGYIWTLCFYSFFNVVQSIPQCNAQDQFGNQCEGKPMMKEKPEVIVCIELVLRDLRKITTDRLSWFSILVVSCTLSPAADGPQPSNIITGQEPFPTMLMKRCLQNSWLEKRSQRVLTRIHCPVVVSSHHISGWRSKLVVHILFILHYVVIDVDYGSTPTYCKWKDPISFTNNSSPVPSAAHYIYTTRS